MPHAKSIPCINPVRLVSLPFNCISLFFKKVNPNDTRYIPAFNAQ